MPSYRYEKCGLAAEPRRSHDLLDRRAQRLGRTSVDASVDNAYEVYYSIYNAPGGIDTLVEATRPLLEGESARKGYQLVSGKFRDSEDFGPTSGREFVEGFHVLDGRTANQWQQDAVGPVDAWLRGLGLRQT